MDSNVPFAPGSISFRCYPHLDRSAPAIVDELITQAALACELGFDGVMTSEHHGGFAGYLPNPLQMAGFALHAMSSGWAAACPLLLPLRPVALVVEETAWLAARFPGRVGLGVAAGALPADFAVMDLDMDDLTARFASGLATLGRALRGEVDGVLAGDPAVACAGTHPIPLLSAAASPTAARRAARAGAGILIDSLASRDRCRALIDAYRGANGAGSCVLVRRAWVGAPPRVELDQQVGVYREYAPRGAQSHWGSDELAAGSDAAAVADALVETLRATGADALNIRVHVPGIESDVVRDQIAALGGDVLPRLRQALGGGPRVP